MSCHLCTKKKTFRKNKLFKCSKCNLKTCLKCLVCEDCSDKKYINLHNSTTTNSSETEEISYEYKNNSESFDFDEKNEKYEKIEEKNETIMGEISEESKRGTFVDRITTTVKKTGESVRTGISAIKKTGNIIGHTGTGIVTLTANVVEHTGVAVVNAIEHTGEVVIGLGNRKRLKVDRTYDKNVSKWKYLLKPFYKNLQDLKVGCFIITELHVKIHEGGPDERLKYYCKLYIDDNNQHIITKTHKSEKRLLIWKQDYIFNLDSTLHKIFIDLYEDNLLSDNFSRRIEILPRKLKQGKALSIIIDDITLKYECTISKTGDFISYFMIPQPKELPPEEFNLNKFYRNTSFQLIDSL